MNNKEKFDYSQLWEEEKQLLFNCALCVPDNGIIVEIGTAQGGSASIFYDAVRKKKNVRIYSYDIAPSKEAYRNLKNTSVQIIPKPSLKGAEEWKRKKKPLIDLLFIDGSHVFKDVFEDLNAWSVLMNVHGTIILHDYDPVERGGVAHLAVRIAAEAFVKQGIIKECSHDYRLLKGIINKSNLPLRISDCVKVIRNLNLKLKMIVKNKHKKLRFICRDEFCEIINYCIKDIKIVPLSRTKRMNGNECLITDLDACYILNDKLSEYRDGFLDMISSRRDFFCWEEILQMCNHTFDYRNFYSYSFKNTDLTSLSRLISGEQIKLKVLMLLLQSLIKERK